MRIVAFSDTHKQHNEISLPESDISIFAGDYDLVSSGHSNTTESLEDFLKWYYFQPGRNKLLVPGNHDTAFYLNKEKAIELCRKYNVIPLIEESCEIEGITLYGSPYNYITNKIPNEYHSRNLPQCRYDILITHAPPLGILDYSPGKMRNKGSLSWRTYVTNYKPKLHIFGHIHECYGSVDVFHNVSICGFNYTTLEKKIENKVKVFEL